MSEHEACCASTSECSTPSKTTCQTTQMGPENCPIEQAVACWSDSYMQAIKEVAVDILKAKIQKAWGPMMDKSADAIMQAMGACWENMLRNAHTQVELREQFKKIFQESMKR